MSITPSITCIYHIFYTNKELFIFDNKKLKTKYKFTLLIFKHLNKKNIKSKILHKSQPYE